MRSRDVSFWEGNDDSGNISNEVKWPTINPPNNLKTFKISYYEEPKATKRIHRMLEADLVPPMTARERLALEEDSESEYPLFDFISGQYTTGRVETISPTPQPVTAKQGNDADDYQSEPPRHQSPPPTERRISARPNKGKEPDRLGYSNSGAGRPERKKQATGGDGTEDIVGLAMPTTRIKAWEVNIPDNLREAKASRYADQWLNACQEQIDKLEAISAYTVERPPPGVSILPGKWVFDLKIDNDGFVTGFRARWVVCGNFQRPGIHDEDKYAPVITDASIKIVFTRIAELGYKWRQVDMITAYLNALIGEKKIYMAQPTGFVKSPGSACRILKAMYGLRESAHLWNKTFDTELRLLGFEPLIEDSCVYKHHTGALLIMYVDDTIIAAPTDNEITDIINLINKKFKTKDLSEPSMFLGCKISRDYEKRTITISQDHYVEKILADAKMQDSKANQIPMTPAYLINSKTRYEIIDSEKLTTFQKHTGRLGWLSYKTRPDITFAVRRLQHVQSKATMADWTAMKTIMRYLKGHPEYRLTLGKNHKERLLVYVDAAHADAEGAKSTEGFVTMYGGAPISWSSRIQTLIAPSSTIAEFCAYDYAVKEGMWLKKLLISLDMMRIDEPVKLLTDSANAITIVKNDGYNRTAKWLDIRYFFVRNEYANGDLEIIKVDGTKNPADGFTKPLDGKKFSDFVDMLGVNCT